MTRIILALSTLLLLAGCGSAGPLYPGLTFGACGSGDRGKTTVYDLGIPECVPTGAAHASSMVGWD
jgi:hypothetical protein